VNSRWGWENCWLRRFCWLRQAYGKGSTRYKPFNRFGIEEVSHFKQEWALRQINVPHCYVGEKGLCKSAAVIRQGCCEMVKTWSRFQVLDRMHCGSGPSTSKWSLSILGPLLFVYVRST